ncbi:helix-turn-helix domain-containing protein [Paracoccus sp. SCSIO 75233]|uniref:helix-turn-helix domain-containing protein n=1 Tax=Paracoccus sp. SCSIO 75233 TaxID=3017782 RepID=UPI0022F03B05|nr:XRE family transcriptional regulator [Paracoccus sp. SCSIO 75233]WBU53807.1 XRE family transcriptional regulator [Paracoccus sp. SCSIO 75233]
MLVSGRTLLSQTGVLGAIEETSTGDERIGKRIIGLRKERNLTLQESARLCGVSASTLSKIERDDLSPTVTTLVKIADGFGVEPGELLTPSRVTPAPGRRAVSRAGNGKPHTSLSCENMLLCSELKNKRMVPVRTRVTARSTEDYPVWPQSDTEIFVWVVSGRMLLHSRIYEPLELGPGDSVYYDANIEHCWTSVGDEDADVIWVVSGG